MRSSWFLKKIGVCAITEVQRLFLFNFAASSQDALGHVWKKCQHVLLSSQVLKVFSKFRVLLWPGPGAPELERLAYQGRGAASL